LPFSVSLATPASVTTTQLAALPFIVASINRYSHENITRYEDIQNKLFIMEKPSINRYSHENYLLEVFGWNGLSMICEVIVQFFLGIFR
jgi:hypothetical protein